MNAHRDELFSELEPRALYSLLAKSKNLPKSDIYSLHKTLGSDERVEMILSMVENGNSEFIGDFITALKDLGYCDIVDLIDPSEIHGKAGKYILHLYYRAHVLMFKVLIVEDNERKTI